MGAAGRLVGLVSIVLESGEPDTGDLLGLGGWCEASFRTEPSTMFSFSSTASSLMGGDVPESILIAVGPVPTSISQRTPGSFTFLCNSADI